MSSPNRCLLKASAARRYRRPGTASDGVRRRDIGGNENGIAVAEATVQWGAGSSAFLHGALEAPDWLVLGGDARGALGLIQGREVGAAAYPMQAEVYAAAGAHGFTLNVTGGLRSPQEGGSVAHVVWSREHCAMWQQHPGQADGLFVRDGRFMPVYGLRLAEHAIYTERYDGLPLFGEAYGAAFEYIRPAFEVHATGFVHDAIASAVEHGDGGALYAEARLGTHAAIGVEGKYAGSDELHVTYGGITGKAYVPDAELLLQAEVEVAHDKVVAGGTANRSWRTCSRPDRSPMAGCSMSAPATTRRTRP